MFLTTTRTHETSNAQHRTSNTELGKRAFPSTIHYFTTPCLRRVKPWSSHAKSKQPIPNQLVTPILPKTSQGGSSHFSDLGFLKNMMIFQDNSCYLAPFCYVFQPFAAIPAWLELLQRSMALNSLCSVSAGGHNKIKYNPVFRGMVRQMAGF
jgi:hypothetical protein